MDPTSLRMMQGASGSGAAAIEFVASAQTQTNSTTLVINKPTGVQSGDLLIALCSAKNARTWTGDTGWTEVIDQGTASPAIRVAYLIAGVSEPASYTFTVSPSEDISGVIVAFRNAAYDTIGTISTAQAGGVQTAPAITLSTSSSAILAFFANTNSSRTWSNPTSGLISTASDSDSDSPSWALYRELNLPSGSTGTRSATCSGTSGSFGCILVGIKPA